MSAVEPQYEGYYEEGEYAAPHAEGGTWIQCYDEESGYPYLYNSETGETKWVDAETSNDLLVTLWQKFYDDNGDEFYYNPHTGESSWELPQNAILEETNEVGYEDQQFADHYEEENIEYDGAKYIEVFNASNDYVRPQSIVENGPYDISLEPSLDQVPYNNLGQSSVHSTRSTKSASYIPMKLLVKKGSREGLLEKKTSFGSLGMMEKKHSAQSLGMKNGSALLLNRTPVVNNSLKPQTPQSQKATLTGFALLKVGASVLRKQIDEHGSTWLEYQAADDGPVFYAEEGGALAGQWNRPHVFDLDDFSSASIVSVEPVNFDHLDDALVSRPSSRRDLHSLVPVAEPALGESLSKKSAGAYAPKNKVKITHFKPAEEPKTEERKSLFGSFINSVFVETVATEDHNAKNTKLDVELTLDALGVEDDDDVEGSEKSTSEGTSSPVPDRSPTGGGAGANSTVSTVSPTPAHGLFVSTASPMGELYLGGGLDGGESPAERIALTPVRKLPPGSGMRKSSFSQLNYIPESQPLFEKEEGVTKDTQPATATSPQDTPLTNEGVGAGMAAVRAMYLNGGALDSTGKDASPARINAVPFQSEVESPEIGKDLFNSLNAESQVVSNTQAEATEAAIEPNVAPVGIEPTPPAEVWIQCYDEESGWPYVYNEATGEVKWVEPESTEQLMAELWEVCYDEDGNQFYYNSATGVSSWDLPENAKLAEGAMAGAGAWIDGAEVPTTTQSAVEGLTTTLTSPTASFPNAAAEDTPLSPSLVSMKKLTSKASMKSLIEKKTSVGNLTLLAKKDSAANLGIKTGSAWIKSKPPEIKNDLKPAEGAPKLGKSSLSGFALLKIGAKVLDKQFDEDGAVWIQYQAVDKGPVFYAEEGAQSAGQWHRPPIFQDGLQDDEVGKSGKMSEPFDEPVEEAEVEAEPVDVVAALPPVQTVAVAPAPELTPTATPTPAPAVAPTVQSSTPATLPPTHTHSHPAVKVASVPQLSLEPIISKQLEQVPTVTNLPSHDSQDVGLYELSGLSMNSKSKKDSQELNAQLSQHSLAMELKALGLDDEADFTFHASAQKPLSSSQTLHEKKTDNVEAKLRDFGLSVLPGEAAKIVDSPYNAKSTEKYPVKVKNVLISPQKAALAGPAQSASPTKAETAGSPPRDKFTNKVVRRAQNNASAGKSPQRGGERDSSFGGSLDRLEATESSFRSQTMSGFAPSSHLPEYPSPMVGGAVKSSFLTELGFASADMSTFNETYLPPQGVSKLVLLEELGRGEKLDAALRRVAAEDQNEDEAAILLRRLQKVSTAGGVPPSVGASRPYGAPREDAHELHAQARQIIDRTCLLLERIEESAVEHKVNERQLLETIVAQRGHLVAPRSLVRDQKTHNSLPVHCCCPQGVKYPQVEHKLEVVADAGAWLLCKDPFFLHGRYFYVNKTTRFVQVGEPFDFQMKKARKFLRKENWNEYELNLVVDQHRLENSQNELLRDAHGGLLVYSPLEDQYSSTGKFDANWAARARMSTTQGAPTGGQGIGGTMGTTMNSRTALLMSQSSLPVFTHQRPASASAATRGTPSAASRLTRSHSGAQDLFRRRSLPKNVWSTVGLEDDGSQVESNPYDSARNGTLQNTVDFPFVSDFAVLDQTARSFDETGGSHAQSDNFFTLKNAFASNNEEEMLQDRNQDFSSPYFDTEMMLELARTKGQSDPQRMLAFEQSMDPETYTRYHQKILAAASEPDNPVPLLELMELLMLEGLGKQAYAVLKRAVTVLHGLSEWCLSAHEMATCRLLSIKMASKYYLRFERPATLYALVDTFPESPLVLSHAAMYFFSMKYFEQAELLFVGALLLNPGYERALLGYSRLLSSKGNFRAALKYLSRIEEDSPLWIAAKLDMAGIQELQGADPGALINAYKNCTYHQALHKDRAYSVAQHCMAYQYQKLNEADKAEFFSSKALLNNPENSIALVLSAVAAATALGRTSPSPVTTGGINIPRSRPGTAGIAAVDSPAEGLPKPTMSKEEIDAKYRSGVLLLPKHQYRWVAVLGYADFVCCVLHDTHRAEQYYAQASKLAFSYSIWSTLALVMFYQYTRGEAGVAGRLLLRTLRHRHADIPIDCLTDFNAFKHREVDTDPVNEVIKFMSLPNPRGGGDEALREDVDDHEVAALYVVIAFYLMDLQEWEEAMKYAAAAIRISETYSPALRCIALITWQHGNTRKVSLRYFAAALEFGRSNPYVLRTCAVVKALEGHQDEAIALMEASVQVGSNCPLSFRALGLMMYLYRRDDVAALECLSRAFALSNSEDIECLRLHGQILMDLRRFKEARTVFQQALYIVPWDPVSLASLGYCVGMLPNKDARRKQSNGNGSVSYHSRLLSMRSFEELIHSRDPEELLEASVTLDLQRILAGQANLSATGTEQYTKMKSKRPTNPFSHSNGMVLSNFAVENELEDVDTDFGSNMTGYAYYWYGMHELKQADCDNADKAKTLFSLASKVGAQDAASSTSALAMYMLGVLAEREEDIEAAERHYTAAVQCEPMEPVALLRLSGLVEEGLSNIKRLIRHVENNPGRRKTKKSKKKAKKGLVDSFGTVSTYRPLPKKTGRASALVDNLAELLSKPLLGPDGDDEDHHGHGQGHSDSEAMDLDAAEALNDYQRRLLMHQRVHEMVVLKKQSYRKLLSKSLVPNPAHHVFVDSYWLERLLHSFSACEDWATLYRSTQGAKSNKRKAKADTKHK